MKISIQNENNQILRWLMDKKVSVENFKSYYNKKIIGSGKNNLIESLLFVFGKRAKQMRLNKL